MFKLLKTSTKSSARLGQLKTAHGTLSTPFFMPIATKAAVKNLTADDIKDLGSKILLSNTYHLYLTPGMAVMKAAGGLHKFMDWQGAILTDSGGFQVFSLSKIREILPGGVQFRSHLDGSKHLLTPKKILKIQHIIGSDIAMILDVCPPSKAGRKEVEEAVKITTKWAKMAAKEIKKQENKKPASVRQKANYGEARQLYFAIVQGGVHKDLRLKALGDLVGIEKDFSAKGGPAFGWDGYAIGGLAVGETSQEMYEVLDYLTTEMPKNKPRYLMGVGTPENIVQAVKRGVDMFDCVIPTREARHGRLYVDLLKSYKYKTINITNAKYKKDFSPINNTNLKQYSKAYLQHLFKTGEPLGMRLATLNNLDFYLRLMEKVRGDIKNGKL